VPGSDQAGDVQSADTPTNRTANPLAAAPFHFHDKLVALFGEPFFVHAVSPKRRRDGARGWTTPE